MSTYVPPGWPAEVRPPDAPDWIATATSWLLDQCPPDYRGHPALLRHPVVLARFAAVFVGAAKEAARRGLSSVRADLRDLVADTAVEAAVETWLAEEARLAGVRRSVDLVEQALRGTRFRPRL
ncbi:hypothetical protein [Nocardioides sp. KR10-350]|uniref:hypothetical protein n=1 Tax=Nocardioides cheoyonin TaxID=3156615 RepID=UPI0032B41FD6